LPDGPGLSVPWLPPGLELLQARAQLEGVVTELHRETGELDDQARGGPVIVDELTAERARQIGVTIGATSHPDVVDVHVALVAAERGHAVLTSDDADIAGVNPGLVLVHV